MKEIIVTLSQLRERLISRKTQNDGEGPARKKQKVLHDNVNDLMEKCNEATISETTSSTAYLLI